MFLDELLGSAVTRRTFLGKQAAVGIAALASLLEADRAGAGQPLDVPGVLKKLHHEPRARRVIWLTMAGGPSHLETFDYKPKLAQMHGEPMPESLTKGQPIAQLQGQKLTCFAPQHPFKKWGQSGQEISTIFPHLGSVADELCIIRSMRTEAINHDPAHTFMNTGTLISGRPSMGSWIWYGLGSDSQDLPGFIVMVSTGKSGQQQPIASRQWHSGFLPSRYQGVQLRSKGDPVLYLSNPAGVTTSRQQDVIEAVKKLNAAELAVTGDPEVSTRISQYEMAFRMQMSVPELIDLRDETQATLDMYGCTPGDGSFASNCLLARRLAERGVRFIQLYHRDWDHHGNIKKDIQVVASEVDQACAALIRDLKQRSMLEDTLIVFAGEFGRTPMAQGNGRDHHMKGFSIWLAGGGIKPGITYGATDDLGYNAVENVVHVHDLHATMLHLLGVDHTRLTYKFQGRDFRLTDVAGEVVHAILA
ncbi:MAG: sulfatase [Pirellulaceae bacterium]|nr:MAG: sulfatase [Pirellulaceae bacterium]